VGVSDWYLKLILLALLLGLSALLLLADFKKNKRYIPYLLILLFANTGFLYDFLGFRTSAAEVIYFSLLLLMTFLWLGDRSILPNLGLAAPIRLYAICSLVGVFTALWFSVRPVNIFIELKSYLGYIFYIFLVVFLTTDKEQVKKYLWVFVVASLIPIMDALPRLREIASEINTVERAGFGMAWGPLNVLVGFLLPIFFLALCLLFLNYGWTRKLFLLGILFSIAIILLYSQTRSAWIAFTLSVAVFMILTRRRLKMFFYVGALLLLLTTAVGSNRSKNLITERIEYTGSEQDSSLKKRTDRWDRAIRTFWTYPVTGSGWGGNLPPKAGGGVGTTSWTALPRWHNSFFEILSQLGLFGVLSFYWIWFRVFKRSFVVCRAATDEDRLILCGLISAVLSCFIYGFGEQQFYRIETASVSWFITGLLVTYSFFIAPPVQVEEVRGKVQSKTSCLEPVVCRKSNLS